LSGEQRRIRVDGAAAGVLALVLWLPKPVANATYVCQKRIASELARRAPGAVLLSDYWDTYALSALQVRALRPLPFDGHYLRNPWMVLELKSAPQVIVRHQGGSDPAVPRPEPVITQYGMKLYQVQRDWYGDCGSSYSLYTSLGPSEK